MILPIQLRQTTNPGDHPAAWFLPGESSGQWLAELTRCGLAESETRLFIVPRLLTDPSPAGLLVVPAKAGALPHPPAGIACRLIGEHLYAPLDAVLHPPITDAEVRSSCPFPVQFFHPAFGLSGFEPESTIRVWNLLESPAERTNHWNFARPGVLPMPELKAIILAQPPSLEDVFGGAEGEIGNESPMDLPPAPDEPKESTWAKSQRNLRSLIAQGIAGVLRQFPHTGLRRTWVNDAEDWANREVRQVNEQLEHIRNKELHRLLHLLQTDPESGLRHAIPLNHFAHRGVAPPGGRLGPRPLDFNPHRLGGGPADFWNVPPDLLQVLRQSYREMADREMQLGRSQRAAYIYAQLLGDLVSAAHSLRQGRLFREAALLYEEQLRNPVEAARCLAEGGLLAEACERYEKLGRWLDVADLYERMDDKAAAEAALRRVINERLTQDDISGAAKLVEERLHNPDEALELLQRAWPASRQAATCVSVLFQMTARLGRHEVALEQLAQFGRTPIPLNLALPLLTALNGPARNYPDELVKHQAADFSRILIARQFARSALSTDEAARLVESLVRLVPQDRLLARDGNRFLAERRSMELRARRVTPPPLPGGKPSLIRRIELPRQMEWLALRNEWHSFYAVGVTANRLTLLRGIWEGEFQSVSWDCPIQMAKNGLMIETTGERGNEVALAVLGRQPFPEKLFPASDQFFGQACKAGTPAWLPPQMFPFSFGDNSVWSGHVAAGRAILSCHDKHGKLQHTIDVTEDLLEGANRTEQTRLCTIAIGNGAAIAMGNRLVLTRGDGGLKRVELPGQVISLTATLIHTRQGVAIMLENGAAMHWIGSDDLIELDRDIISAKCAFVPAGPLVLISDANAILLNVSGIGVQNVCRVELTGQRPVGVSATASPGQFAVLGAGGDLTIYGVPR